jgi:segregation and condensation protein A
MAKEQEILQTIVISYDWNEVIIKLVEEANLDPWDIDITKLADLFLQYLYTLHKFDFRIPARFILIAAILLRMKCEIVKLKEEKEKKVEKIDINVPLLQPPVTRIPKRRVTLNELVNALQKAIEFQERKRQRKLAVRRAVEALIVEEEDIETRMKKLYEIIKNDNISKFSELLTTGEREEIVSKFTPLLHLVHNELIKCEQPEAFGEIFIYLLSNEFNIKVENEE